MLAHNRLQQSQTLNVGCYRPSIGRRVQVRAAAAPQDSQTSRRFMALTSLDGDSLAPHVNYWMEGEILGYVGLDKSDDDMPEYWQNLFPGGAGAPARDTGGPTKWEPVSEEDAIKKPVVTSSTTFYTAAFDSTTILSLEGSQAAVDKLVSSKVVKAAVEVFPTCLVEPQQEEGSSSSNNNVLQQEEVQAHATWGLQAVKAMESGLTGKGVKVGTLLQPCRIHHYTVGDGMHKKRVMTQQRDADCVPQTHKTCTLCMAYASACMHCSGLVVW